MRFILVYTFFLPTIPPTLPPNPKDNNDMVHSKGGWYLKVVDDLSQQFPPLQRK